MSEKDEALKRAKFYAEKAQDTVNQQNASVYLITAFANLSTMYSNLYMAMRIAENDSKPSN